eukprot:10059022-Ditylum_brightwellii.AAC.1
MEHVRVIRDVVTYNAILDAVCSQVSLARKLFQEGVERGFYARVSRLGTQWLELDLHFLSLGGGEVALGWWFEECLVPYLGNSSKLASVKSIDIVTGYGKTRMRGARQGDDGMRKRVRAMLQFMNVREIDQPNKGRIHIDKEALTREVEKNGGKIVFDAEGYRKFRAEQTTANAMPNVVQVRRSTLGGAGNGGGNQGRKDMPKDTSFASGGKEEHCNHQQQHHMDRKRRYPDSNDHNSSSLSQQPPSTGRQINWEGPKRARNDHPQSREAQDEPCAHHQNSINETDNYRRNNNSNKEEGHHRPIHGNRNYNRDRYEEQSGREIHRSNNHHRRNHDDSED